jgi:hypothetical protein
MGQSSRTLDSRAKPRLPAAKIDNLFEEPKKMNRAGEHALLTLPVELLVMPQYACQDFTQPIVDAKQQALP